MNEERLGMPGIGVADLLLLQIRNQVEGGREHGRARLAQDCAQIIVDLAQQPPGFGGEFRELLDERAHNGRDQRRTHPVTHHVADKDSRLRIRQRAHVEEVAADGAGWKYR